jgi:hypothetical protein
LSLARCSGVNFTGGESLDMMPRREIDTCGPCRYPLS